MSIAHTWLGRTISIPRSNTDRSCAPLGLRCPRMAIKRFYPHPFHQRLTMTPADLVPLGIQQASQHPRAGEGELQMQPIEMPHDLQVVADTGRGQVVHAATADAQVFACLVMADRARA